MIMDNEMPIPGWGVDRRITDRPGVPFEEERYVGFDTLHGEPPYRETIPLKGLSGVLRRAAYRYPDWKTRRWMLLRFADRIDALEARLAPRALVLATGALGFCASALTAWRRRR